MQTKLSDAVTILVDQPKELGSNPKIPENNKDHTKRGYDFFELLSALQKGIRRSKEYDAVFWAVELETFNHKALWNRLRVIASEDIGIADPVAPLIIDVLERNYYNFKGKKDDPNRLFLVDAVLYLARCPKSRIVDDLLNVVYGDIQHEDKKLPIPDYALDKHTPRGRAMGRGWEHFFNEGTRLSSETIDNPYTARAKHLMMKYGRPKPHSFQEKVLEEPAESKLSQKIRTKTLREANQGQ
jgi:replication-associated recombination protein RarA